MAGQKTILIVEARYYADIADAMADGARPLLEAAGFVVERIAVPGTFEIPAAIRMATEANGGAAYAGFLALGCVIRGETDHYKHISREVSRGLMDLALRVPLGLGILTCETYDQAWHRADPKQTNKGAEAATACLRMIELRTRFGASRR